MKHVTRSIGFALLTYLFSFVAYMVPVLIFGSEDLSLGGYAVYWLIITVIMFLLGKWYFKKVEPTTKGGLQLGIVTLIVAFAIDALAVLATYLSGNSLDTFVLMYTNYKFYLSTALVLLVCTYMGYEYDATFSAAAPTNIPE